MLMAKVKVSNPEYSSPKISHYFNLAPIENKALANDLSKPSFGYI